MSDVISFDCTGCGLPYKVATSYAGREFNCKKCGTRLCVPQPGQPVGIQIEPEVELDSGGEVMRRTTSGRQVAAEPTRMFKNQRETSARLAAVGPDVTAKKSSKGLLIAVVLLLVIAGGGAAAAFAMGLFDGQSADTNQPVAKANNTDSSNTNPETERDEILKQLDVSGQTAAQFMDLFKRAEKAKLENSDLAQIGQRIVGAMIVEEGAGYSDADLMAFADRMSKLNVPSDAKGLYSLVVARNRSKTEKSPENTKAQKLLGKEWLDFGAQITRAAELRDTGVIQGVGELHDELLDMESRADDGWAGMSDKARFEEIVDKLNTAQDELNRIRAEDPFRMLVAKARMRFELEKASRIGNWLTIGQAPFVFFVQQRDGESESATRDRIKSALDAAEQFPEFFQDTVIKPLKLTRTLPSDLSQEERDEAPFEVLLFRSASYWTPYLKDHDITVDSSSISTVTEPATGRISMVYEDERESLGKFLRMLIDNALYSYHPNAPKTKAEDDAFIAYQSYWLKSYFAAALSFTSRSSATGQFNFFTNDSRPKALLKRLLEPYKVAENGKIDSFGGPAFTAKQIVGLTKIEEAAPILRANFESYDGWEPTYLELITNSSNTANLLRSYMHALFLFTYFGSGDDHPYRDHLFKFIRMDLDGEVDHENPLPAFEKAFGLDANGWKKFEKDFLAWQSE